MPRNSPKPTQPPAPLTPLTPLTYHILLALADGDRHGYGIIREIEEKLGEAASPSTGALYLALQRMEDTGLVEESSHRPEPEEDDARRRYYRMTAIGRAAARAESERLASLVGVAAAKRLVTGATVAASLRGPGRS